MFHRIELDYVVEDLCSIVDDGISLHANIKFDTIMIFLHFPIKTNSYKIVSFYEKCSLKEIENFYMP